MLGCRMGFTYRTVPANEVMKRCKYFDILTLYRLENSLIDCPDFLNEINIPVMMAPGPDQSSEDDIFQPAMLTTLAFHDF
ncbi:hypothetical protein J6590_087880 [Homalodisca vitripennis]|nr:hypothetical protein J6590_087880 [Homalodisca vitripennis]